MNYFSILTADDRYIEAWLPDRFNEDLQKVLAILSENGVVKEPVEY